MSANHSTPPKKSSTHLDPAFRHFEDEKAWLRKMVTEITDHYRSKNPMFRNYADMSCIWLFMHRVDWWGDVLWQGHEHEHRGPVHSPHGPKLDISQLWGSKRYAIGE